MTVYPGVERRKGLEDFRHKIHRSRSEYAVIETDVIACSRHKALPSEQLSGPTVCIITLRKAFQFLFAKKAAYFRGAFKRRFQFP